MSIGCPSGVFEDYPRYKHIFLFLAQTTIWISGDGGHGMYYHCKYPQKMSKSSYLRVIHRNTYIQID